MAAEFLTMMQQNNSYVRVLGAYYCISVSADFTRFFMVVTEHVYGISLDLSFAYVEMEALAWWNI